MNIDENPFRFLEDYDVNTVAQILSSELPFVAGAALSRTSAVFNAKVMANMPEKTRNEIASAISKYRKIPTEVMYDIAEELEKKLSSPQSSHLQQQKNSMLANLDLGALMQDINKLKKKDKPRADASARPEPVASRVIRPEDYDAFLRGELSEFPQTGRLDNSSGIVDPGGFIPEQPANRGDNKFRKSPPLQNYPDPAPAHSHRPQKPEPETIPAELSPETRKELALQQALLHTRTKKQETRVSRPVQKTPPRKNPEYKAQKIDGMALAAHILRESSPELRKRIMQEVPDLYTRLNDRMFDFADLEKSPPETIGMIFSGIDPEISALALRFSSDHLKNTALTSISRRKAKLVIDEFKRTAKDRVRLTDIEDAQQKVIDYAITLQNRGEIIIDPNDSGIV